MHDSLLNDIVLHLLVMLISLRLSYWSKVKVIRCDNRTEFKNKEMNQFYEMKGILRQYSVARTLQENGVAERRNKTLIKAVRTMLVDSKLPTTFWAEAVNIAFYVQNRVLVVKPHNKTPYELFHGRTPTLSFMRPFGCPVTILNTIDHLGKFDGKADEGFFVGYSLNSKAFRVFNSRTRIVEENLHIRFSESTPNVVGSGPDWLFDIDALTRTMNYEPIVAGTQSNGFAGTKASDNAGQARKETEPVKNYILLPLWPADPSYSKSSQDDRSKPSSDDGKKVDEDSRKDSEGIDQEKENNVNSTNNVNVASTNKVNAIGGKTSIELPLDPIMTELEDYSIFEDDEDVVAVGWKCHNLGLKTNYTNKKNVKEFGGTWEEPEKVIHALKDPSWIEAMQEEILQFKLQEVWTLVDLPNRKKAIGTKWVFRNKKDERGIMIRNKARLVAQGYTQEEGIDYDEEGVKGEFINREPTQALVDGKKIIITESTMRRDLQLEDAEGVDCLPNATIFEQLALMGYEQSSVPSDNVADEVVYKELDESLVRAATTASSLKAEQGSERVLDLETTKTTQANEIASLKKRVKKLKKKDRPRTHKLKRLYKVSLSARVESSRDEKDLGEDASKQGRIADIDADAGITMVSTHFDVDIDMFGVNDLVGDEVVAESEVDVKAAEKRNVVEEVVAVINAASKIPINTATITDVEITLDQALVELKNAKPKADKVVIQEPEQGITTTTPTTIIPVPKPPHDKGKEIMIEKPVVEQVKPMKRLEQMRLDEELAFKLQAKEEEEEEERTAKEKA
ncbi:retrovirus-related pol polyprotein from transposon TNT 1-94 [Tanacetum coccineum]